jgi:hypothetical protein
VWKSGRVVATTKDNKLYNVEVFDDEAGVTTTWVPKNSCSVVSQDSWQQGVLSYIHMQEVRLQRLREIREAEQLEAEHQREIDRQLSEKRVQLSASQVNALGHKFRAQYGRLGSKSIPGQDVVRWLVQEASTLLVTEVTYNWSKTSLAQQLLEACIVVPHGLKSPPTTRLTFDDTSGYMTLGCSDCSSFLGGNSGCDFTMVCYSCSRSNSYSGCSCPLCCGEVLTEEVQQLARPGPLNFKYGMKEHPKDLSTFLAPEITEVQIVEGESLQQMNSRIADLEKQLKDLGLQNTQLTEQAQSLQGALENMHQALEKAQSLVSVEKEAASREVQGLRDIITRLQADQASRLSLPQLEGSAAWSNSEVASWGQSLSIDCSSIFARERITGEDLADLSHEVLKEFGFTAFGDRNKILKAIQKLPR